MARSASQPGIRSGAFAAVVGLMLSLWLATYTLAVLPQLHQLLHQDAHHPAHHCLITQVQQNHLLSQFVAVVSPASPCRVIFLPWQLDFQSPSAIDYRLSPSRAPPCSGPSNAA